jgi:predicted CopG family antitoxin
MPTTTVKLESDLVEKVAALKEPEQSISAFVRSLIEKEHRTRQLHESARVYELFLRENPEERQEMEVWESAPLSTDVAPKQP